MIKPKGFFIQSSPAKGGSGPVYVHAQCVNDLDRLYMHLVSSASQIDQVCRVLERRVAAIDVDIASKIELHCMLGRRGGANHELDRRFKQRDCRSVCEGP